MAKKINLGKVGMTAGGSYQSGKAYERLTCVSYNHESWVSRKDVPAGIAPAEGSEYWQKMASRGEQGPQGQSYVDKELVPIVDNLTTGGSSNVLSAEQGKVLKAELTELESNIGIVSGFNSIAFSINPGNGEITLIFDVDLFIYGTDNSRYTIPQGSYVLPNNRNLVYDITNQGLIVGRVDENPSSCIILAFNNNGVISNGLLAGVFANKEMQKLGAAYKANVGVLSEMDAIDIDVVSTEITITIGNNVGIFAISNSYYAIPSGTYVLPENHNLVLNLSEEVSIVPVGADSSYDILLANNNKGKITSGYLANMYTNKAIQEEKSDVSSSVNTLYPSFAIYHINGYMDNKGEVVESGTIEGLITDWIDVKKGDIILYRGFGYASGVSWVSEGKKVLSAAIDASEYVEVEAPQDGKMRFSSYRFIGGGRTLNLEVKYKVANHKRINKTMVNVGHSIWWFDGQPSRAANVIDGEGTPMIGYQSLLQEQFLFNKVTRYCYSGFSLGVGTKYPNNSIMATHSSSFVEQEQAIWTLDTITNDFGNEVTLGTPSDYENATGINTYYGALRAFRDKILALSLNPIVICSNALHRAGGKENSLGLTLEDYEKALLYVACRNGWYFVDQYRYGGINENNLSYTLYDGLHPTNFGFRLAVKPWIEQFRILQNL